MKKAKLIISILFLAALMIPGIIVIFGPTREYSENENRYLAGPPKPGADFQKDTDSFFSDQFPGRDALMSAGSVLKTATGRRDIKDTYIGKDGFLFEKITDSDIDGKIFMDNLKRIDNLAAEFSDTRFSMMAVPSAGTILKESLPPFAKMYDASDMLKSAASVLSHVSLTDPTGALSALGDDAFYKSDHHWTTEGAFAAYHALMGEDGAFASDTFETVSEDFLGTLYSRTLLPSQVTDHIEIAPTGDESLYDFDALDEKDKYRIFFGGNFGRIDIKGTGEGSLLVIKDSFANCFVPFLTADYESITMIDLRFFPGSVRELLSESDFDDALVLYELSNFANDSNLAKIVL